MNSVRTMKPVKILILIPDLEDSGSEERIEHRLALELGPSDHRLSLIPSESSIHHVLLSFERLSAVDMLPIISDRIRSEEQEFSARLQMGFLDNYEVVLGAPAGEKLFQFRNGVIQLLPSTPPELTSGEVQGFFISVRNTFRAQLRSMCLLRE